MRKITLFVGAYTDLGLEKFLDLAAGIGYQGVELMVKDDIVNLEKTVSDSNYRAYLHEQLEKRGLFCQAMSSSRIGKCVGDDFTPVLDTIVPPRLKGKPDDIHKWAVDSMMAVPTAAKLFGVKTVETFLGSSVWRYLYPYPRLPDTLVEDGFARIAELWKPILDEFERQGIKLAFEAHPTEIAYDYYTTERLFEAFDNHPAFKLNFDPSHLVWQGVDPIVFLRRFGRDVAHMHVKDALVRLDGRASILASHLPFGDRRRGWDFRSPGHGQVDFKEVFRELTAVGYDGPLSVEWEDNGMDRLEGAKDAFKFVSSLNFSPSNIEFDTLQKT